MSSQAQTEANRRNAQKSTGPKTPEGKAISSRNAITHGMLARIVPHDVPGFSQMLVGLYQSMKPQDELQRLLVDQIGVTALRLRRVLSAEQNFLHIRAGNWPVGPDNNSRVVHDFLEKETTMNIIRYETMLNRLMQRLLNNYRDIKTGEAWAQIRSGDCPYLSEKEVVHAEGNPPENPSAYRPEPEWMVSDLREEDARPHVKYDSRELSIQSSQSDYRERSKAAAEAARKEMDQAIREKQQREQVPESITPSPAHPLTPSELGPDQASICEVASHDDQSKIENRKSKITPRLGSFRKNGIVTSSRNKILIARTGSPRIRSGRNVAVTQQTLTAI